MGSEMEKEYKIKTYHLSLSVFEDIDEDDGWEDRIKDEGFNDSIVSQALDTYVFEDLYQQWDNNPEFPVLAVIEKDGRPVYSTTRYGRINNIDDEIKRMRDNFEEFIKEFKEAFEANGKNPQ